VRTVKLDEFLSTIRRAYHDFGPMDPNSLDIRAR
jgi:hypothetical protein